MTASPLQTRPSKVGRRQINARFGLVAAQRALRHAQVAVTAAHYVELKQRPVLGFGHLLTKDGRTIVPMDESQAFSDKELAEYEEAFNARPERPKSGRAARLP